MIVGEVQVIVNQERTNLIVEDFIPAGATLLNTNFNTTSDEVKEVT
jgi:uncharacterized protein YfaS (alpha-2-macroglobulin family)